MNKLIRKVTGRLSFRGKYNAFAKLSRSQRPELSIEWGDRWPRIGDDVAHHPFDAHYVYHTAWAARCVAAIAPKKHVDISSYLYFSTITSAFVPVDFYDYRPAGLKLSNLDCKFADLCDLPFPDSSVESLSCMHTIEHIGLGRYGDPVDPLGDQKAIRELQRVTAKNGSLLLVVPIGRPRIQYNAHRIYDPAMIESMLADMKLRTWSLLPDDDSVGLIENPDRQFALSQRYGCGCFWFEKL